MFFSVIILMYVSMLSLGIMEHSLVIDLISNINNFVVDSSTESVVVYDEQETNTIPVIIKQYWEDPNETTKTIEMNLCRNIVFHLLLILFCLSLCLSATCCMKSMKRKKNNEVIVISGTPTCQIEHKV
jgi:hypothetical protein